MMQQWFLDAKLGIFIHYGIYAVKGIAESWSFFNGQISYDDYMSQLDGFTASKYDPESWAELFERAGAKYAVMTTKHHDGVALWDTQANDLSVVRRTPAGRDLVAPYVDALRRHGLKVGFYFSHLDWSHPDYASVLASRRHEADYSEDAYSNRFAYPPKGQEDSEKWQSFLRFHRAQLQELCSNFGPIDVLWFDGEWERDPEQWDMAGLRKQLELWQPKCIFNARLSEHGDYATPEQGLPTAPPEGPWEFCVTINDSWGYQGQDDNHKSVRQIVRMFAEVIGMGGNLLLDVGPREDGTLQPPQVERLLGLGDWIKRHSEAIYGTVAGLPAGLFYGASTLSKDRTKLFLFFFDRPWDQVAVKGILNQVESVSVVGSGTRLSHKMIGGLGPTPGVLWIDVPEREVDSNATVLEVRLDGPLRTYVGEGRA